MADLEVMTEAGATTIDLHYAPGAVEYAGLGISAVTLIAWLLTAWQSKRVTRRATKKGWDDIDARRGPR